MQHFIKRIHNNSTLGWGMCIAKAILRFAISYVWPIGIRRPPRKRKVMGSISTSYIYFQFELFTCFASLTAQQSQCKWNPARNSLKEVSTVNIKILEMYFRSEETLNITSFFIWRILWFFGLTIMVIPHTKKINVGFRLHFELTESFG